MIFAKPTKKMHLSVIACACMFKAYIEFKMVLKYRQRERERGESKINSVIECATCAKLLELGTGLINTQSTF